MEFIRPVPPGAGWIEGRAEADAVDEHGGLARGEIVDEADQLLGVASLRLMKAAQRRVPVPAVGGHDGLPAAAPPVAPAAPVPAAPAPAAELSAAAAAGIGTGTGIGSDRGPHAGDPARRFLGVVSREAGAGRSVWTLRPPPATANSYGMVHGGVLGLLAHQVASDAQGSLTGPDEQVIPLDLVVNFYRGVPASGRLLAATAHVTHRGRRFVVAEGEVAGPGRQARAASVGRRPGPRALAGVLGEGLRQDAAGRVDGLVAD